MEDASLLTATEQENPLLGSWGVIPHPMVAEAVSGLGYDFVSVDVEHSPVSFETLADMLRAVDATEGRSLQEYIEANDENFATHVQLESTEAIENAAEIAAVDGIDGVFVGPMDLSLALGAFADWESERFLDAVETALEAARAADVAAGTFAASSAEREQRLAWDIDYLVAGVDQTHLTEGAKAALEHSRAVIDDVSNET